MKNIKVIFMGTPSFAVPILNALINEYDVVGVVCQPDRANGKMSPIKEIAVAKSLNLFQPQSIATDYKSILDLHPDIIVTCAYGQLVPKVILDFPKYGCINVHASLLPKLRGGAPIHHAIMNGDTKTGVTVMYMSERMDAGAIISQVETIITPEDNLGTLYDRLSLMGRDLLIDTIPDIISGNINPIKQNESEATLAPTIKREDEHIDFSKSKREVLNLIRALNPSPGAYCIIENKIFKVWNARISDDVHQNSFTGEIVCLYEDGIGVKTLNGEVVFTEVQLEGHKKMSAKDFLNGLKNKELLIGKICD